MWDWNRQDQRPEWCSEVTQHATKYHFTVVCEDQQLLGVSQMTDNRLTLGREELEC